MIWNRYRYKKECLATYDALLPSAPKEVAFSAPKARLSWFQLLALPLTAVGVMALTVFLIKPALSGEAVDKAELSEAYLSGAAYVKPLAKAPQPSSSNLKKAYVPNWHYDTMKSAAFFLDFFGSLYQEDSFPSSSDPVDFTCSTTIRGEWTLYCRIQLFSHYDKKNGKLDCLIHSAALSDPEVLKGPLFASDGGFQKIIITFNPVNHEATSFRELSFRYAHEPSLTDNEEWAFVQAEGASALCFEAKAVNGAYSEEDQNEFTRLKKEAETAQAQFKLAAKSLVSLGTDYSELYQAKVNEYHLFD